MGYIISMNESHKKTSLHKLLIIFPLKLLKLVHAKPDLLIIEIAKFITHNQ